MLEHHLRFQLQLIILAIVKYFFSREALLATSEELLAHVMEYNFETT